MADLNRQLRNIVDRRTMHALIDALPEDQLAILCAVDANGDTCWSIFGNPRFREGVGLLEAVKANIIADHFAEDPDGRA